MSVLIQNIQNEFITSYNSLITNNNMLFDLLDIIQYYDNHNLQLNNLNNFISKYNLNSDIVTDIYKYFDYKSDNIYLNIMLCGESYFIDAKLKLNENTYINFYEFNIICYEYNIFSKNIQSNYTNIYLYENNSEFYYKYNKYNKYKNSEINFNNIIDKLKFNELFNKYIDENLKYNSFEYIKNSNIENLNICGSITLSIIKNTFNIQTLTQNILINDISFTSGITKLMIQNIDNTNRFDAQFLSQNTFCISYKNENKIITKQIYIDTQIYFDSELYIYGFSHKINKLNCKFTQENKNLQNMYIPELLFEKSVDSNFLVVYAYQNPCKYKYNINIIDKHSEPKSIVYEFDTNGSIFYNEMNCAVNCSINKYKVFYKDNKMIEINPDTNDDYEINCKILDNLRFKNYYKFTNNDNNMFNKEITLEYNEHIYKFIINCGIYSSKYVDNIAVVVESGANTHDISKITLKADGTAEIIRTNNSNQLIIKSATRNKFSGNVGYKFAISNNIPVVVYLEIPDDAEVVFDNYHNKFRCNKCKVTDIQPIKDKNVKEMQNTCSVCLIERPNVMFDPCQHVVCSECVASYNISDNKCHECNTKIESYITLTTNIISDKIQISKANSAIYCSDFEYKIGEEILIDDFNITEYWKCTSGIHFHSNIDDVYAWLEFIDIPELF